MVASGDFTSSDGPGGKASRFLDAVVAFVVGIFQPIFRFLLSAIFTRQPRQHNNQNRDRDNTLGDSSRNNNIGDSNESRTNPDGQDGDHQGDGSPESMQRHSSTARAPHAYGPKAVDGSAHPVVKPVLPLVGPAVSASRPVKQEGAPANGVAAKTALGDATNGVNHTSKHHVVGKEEAEENLHDQVDLAPAVQPVEDEEEPEDPAIAAERAIHHGFMDQALDMVCLTSHFFYRSSSKSFMPAPTPCLLDSALYFPDVNDFLTRVSLSHLYDVSHTLSLPRFKVVHQLELPSPRALTMPRPMTPTTPPIRADPFGIQLLLPQFGAHVRARADSSVYRPAWP